jgi:PPM family protein phosphatase
MLRQLQLPLAAIKELLACDPADAAARIAEHWRDAEAAHGARRDLADYLVNWLSGWPSTNGAGPADRAGRFH